jgi:hypothetical protein
MLNCWQESSSQCGRKQILNIVLKNSELVRQI